MYGGAGGGDLNGFLADHFLLSHRSEPYKKQVEVPHACEHLRWSNCDGDATLCACAQPSPEIVSYYRFFESLSHAERKNTALVKLLVNRQARVDCQAYWSGQL